MDSTNKLALVLDMDECIVHSTFASEHAMCTKAYNKDECFEIFMEDGEKAVVCKRPGLDAFLNSVKHRYDIYVFTASLPVYSDAVLDYLDPKGDIFIKRFYRDSCQQVTNGVFLKDLQLIRKDLAKVVLVDNNPISFLLYPSNGIPVPSFYDNMNDISLDALAKVLDNIDQLPDIRPRLRKMFHLSDLLAIHRQHILS